MGNEHILNSQSEVLILLSRIQAMPILRLFSAKDPNFTLSLEALFTSAWKHRSLRIPAIR